MRKYKGLKKRVQRLRGLTNSDEYEMDPELLIPQKRDNQWLIEGMLFDTEKEALIFAEKLRIEGFTALLDEIMKDETLFDDIESKIMNELD